MRAGGARRAPGDQGRSRGPRHARRVPTRLGMTRSRKGPAMMRVAFAGTFAARLEHRVRARMGIPCDIVAADEVEIVPRLPDVDVLVTLAFTREMAAATRRLK